MHFTVEEENLICIYHNADRRRTIGKITTALPVMDGNMRAMAKQNLSKLGRMTDSDYDDQKFHFTDENE
ncbi:MAG: transposon-transfer assisting family protein [Candidatus Fimimorpha sp.]